MIMPAKSVNCVLSNICSDRDINESSDGNDVENLISHKQKD